MPEPVKTSAAPAIGVVLGAVAFLLWVFALTTLSDLSGSDAAGNAYARAYAAIELFLLWGLPALDLETTGPLCKAALNQIYGDVMKVYRPKSDDPRPYSELLQRLGAHDPLTALVWLAGHGCEAEPELSEAEELVKAYGDSPARATMLATLERLHRK